MKIKKQELHLMLIGKVLFIFRFDRDGNCIDDCNLRDPRAVLPDALEQLIKKRIKRRVRSIHSSRSEARNAIFTGLSDAAKACGCEPRLHRGGRVLTFYLNCLPLVSFDMRGNTAETCDETCEVPREYANSQATFKTYVVLYEGEPYFGNVEGL